MYNFIVVYVTDTGRQCKVECHQSYNIAVSIAKIQLERGAKQAYIEVTKAADERVQ